MDSSSISKVNREVYKRHPHMAGASPKVSQQTENRYLLLYTKNITIGAARSMEQTIRVTADGQGNIIRMSASKS
jgi:CDP-diacylglycerol pyrophosphatase